MRIVQFEIPEQGRRLGVNYGDAVSDITAARPKLKRVYDAFQGACQPEESLAAFLPRLQATHRRADNAESRRKGFTKGMGRLCVAPVNRSNLQFSRSMVANVRTTEETKPQWT